RACHAEMGVRHGSAAGARHQADPGQLGPGRLGVGRGRARPQRRAVGRLHETSARLVSASARLAELGLTLPPVAAPVASYQPAVRTGSYVYTSGQLPLVDGKLPAMGKVGGQIGPSEAQGYARTCALNALAAIDALVGIDQVARVV